MVHVGWIFCATANRAIYMRLQSARWSLRCDDRAECAAIQYTYPIFYFVVLSPVDMLVLVCERHVLNHSLGPYS